MPVVGSITGQYDPRRVEEWVKEFWEREKIYEKLREWRKGRPKFYFLDGPPYPSSDVPHAGTLWNRVIKDAILRYKRMAGFDVMDTPGFDCHGLPIEVKIEQQLGIRVKREIEERVGIAKFVELCKQFALRNAAGMTKWFKEFGVFMNWSSPYYTLRDEYIEAEWWLVKRAWEQGLLAREYRVVYWCPRCGTTLAEYEVEYREIEDPSLYVMFELVDEPGTYLLIWTTTPWTLPANAFVMVHPDAVYVKVEVDGRRVILAKQRLEHVMREAGVRSYRVVGEVRGSELVGKRYRHPLEDVIPLQKRLSRYHVVVDAREYVTLYEGTGLVHAAPGHGFEDFDVAIRRGWADAVVAPVDDEGRFTDDAGPLKGLHVREANEKIIEMLRERGAVFHTGVVRHRYPVCWRCKTPVILRATPQWIIKVTRLRDKLAEEVKKARWLPSWALERIKAMIENLQDWVLSRQRYWGAPLPVWVCEKCGNVIVVGSVEELEKLGGRKPKELHRPWIDEVTLRCPKCGGVARRVPDVMDVWLDSGVAFYASLGHPSRVKPMKVEFITEGHDQTRGWFFSLLRAGVIGFGEVPYKTVLVHGFMLDEHGREMHKSLGNYVGADDLLKRASRDVFRFWVLQNTVWEDARFSWKHLDQARRELGVVWNVFVFASTYMRLDKFDPTRHTLESLWDALRPEDKWMLSRLARLVEEVTKAFEEYRVHEAARKLRAFILEDVSRWYIRLIRRRVWTEAEDRSKYAAYAVLYRVLRDWLAMASTIVPFITEYLYQHFVRPAEPDAPPSVAMLDWPRVERKWLDERLEKMMSIVREVVEAAAAARMKAGLKLRQPVRKLVVFTSSSEVAEAIEALKPIVMEQANAKQVEVKSPREIAEVVTYQVEPVYSRIGPRYRRLTKKIVEHITRHAEEVAKSIIESGVYRTIIDGVEVEITKDDVNVKVAPKAGFAIAEADWGTVAIDTRLTREEIVEGFVKDVVRRIQYMRKQMNLPVDAYVNVYIVASREALDMIRERLDYLAAEVRAKNVVLSEKPVEAKGFTMEWEIGDEKVIITVEQLGSAG